MKNTSPTSRLVVVATLGLILSAGRGIAVTETDSQSTSAGNAFDGDISATDLLEGLTPVKAVYSNTTATHTAGDLITSGDNGFPLTGINDGDKTSNNDTVGAGSGSTLFATVQLGDSLPAEPRLTYQLNLSTSPGGYTLSNITSINGFNGGYSAQLADQDYSISYNTVTDSTFHLLTTVDYSPFPDATVSATNSSRSTSTEVSLSNLGVAGVSEIQFTFLNPFDDNSGVTGGELIREIDVHGTDTPVSAVPEPTTYALMGAALLMGFCAFRRRLLPN